MAGGDYCFEAFEQLADLLLSVTVLADHGGVRLSKGPEPGKAVLGGWSGPQDPLALRDRRYLRLSVSMYLDQDSDRLKVEKSTYQYQNDQGGAEWIFRYDYIRENAGRHPGAHFQLRGTLDERDALEAMPLSHIHFPTGRVSLEAVIRLLAEEFRVPCATNQRVWRPLLAASEAAFLEIAHSPLSGPGG